MDAPATATRSVWDGVGALVAGGLGVVVAVATVGAVYWPPSWDPTFLTLVLLYAVAASHPVRVRHDTRSEFIVVVELVAAISVLALPPTQALWVAILGGAVLGPAAVMTLSPLERMRRAPLSRHLFNMGANTVGVFPMVALAATARPHGTTALTVATLVGLVVHGLVSHVLVTAAIHLSVGRDGGLHPDDAQWSPTPAALAIGLVALPVGLVVARHDPDWPLLVALAVTLATLSRARMDRDHTSHRLLMVTRAGRRLAGAHDVAELDARLASTLRSALGCRTVEIRTATEAPVPSPSSISSELETNCWVVAAQPAMGNRWTTLDQELLDAVVSVAAPQRERLELLRQTVEAERFASLVLATAGHDITNQLHAATMAIGTATRWSDRLDDDDRQRLADQAVRAIHRASTSLRDLVAIGASGPGATTTAAEVALFVRALGPGIHVVCDNVDLATPAAVVERALENLVRNAQRHHVGDEPLQVRLLDDGPDVRIEVCDRGPGLAPDHVETLFAPFSQLADDRGRRGSLGLGLFIARGLAESAGGSLDYHDREGGGAVFVLRVPSVAKDATERVHERIVLGPRPDGDAQAALEPGLGREVADEDALAE